MGQILSTGMAFIGNNYRVFIRIITIPVLVNAILLTINNGLQQIYPPLYKPMVFVSSVMYLLLDMGFAVYWCNYCYFGQKRSKNLTFWHVFAWNASKWWYFLASMISILIFSVVGSMVLTIVISANGFGASLLQYILNNAPLVMVNWQEVALIPVILLLIYPFIGVLMILPSSAIDKNINIFNIIKLCRPFQLYIFKNTIILLVVYFISWLFVWFIYNILDNDSFNYLTIQFFGNIIAQMIDFFAMGLVITCLTLIYTQIRNNR